MSEGSFSCPLSSNFDLRAGPAPEGLLLLCVLRAKVPGPQAFSPTIIHHEISFVMSSDEPSILMMLSLPLCLAS